MPRPHAHPLNRWAPIDPDQRKACQPIAEALSRTDVPIRDHVITILCFERLATRLWVDRNFRKPEQLEIDELSWKKALTEELRKCGSRAPVQIPEQILEIVWTLHRVPAECYNLSSNLLVLARKADTNFSFAHLTRLHAAMVEYPLTESNQVDATYKINEALIHFAIHMVCVEGWSPKRLEVDLAKRRGDTPAGRPRKRKTHQEGMSLLKPQA